MITDTIQELQGLRTANSIYGDIYKIDALERVIDVLNKYITQTKAGLDNIKTWYQTQEKHRSVRHLLSLDVVFRGYAEIVGTLTLKENESIKDFYNSFYSLDGLNVDQVKAIKENYEKYLPEFKKLADELADVDALICNLLVGVWINPLANNGKIEVGPTSYINEVLSDLIEDKDGRLKLKYNGIKYAECSIGELDFKPEFPDTDNYTINNLMRGFSFMFISPSGYRCIAKYMFDKRRLVLFKEKA